MTSLSQEWKLFEERVVPVDAPDVQRSEMRKAWYAGATVTLFGMSAISGETHDEDVAALRIESLFEEARQFAASLHVTKG